jgi:hypothetical protein
MQDAELEGLIETAILEMDVTSEELVQVDAGALPRPRQITAEAGELAAQLIGSGVSPPQAEV